MYVATYAGDTGVDNGAFNAGEFDRLEDAVEAAMAGFNSCHSMGYWAEVSLDGKTVWRFPAMEEKCPRCGNAGGAIGSGGDDDFPCHTPSRQQNAAEINRRKGE